ncbi:MAG: hypothetical protein U9R26_02110 [Campylobacterota bacterium]|nr:hypothetical protein [Campylobacterota bacterium]
MKNLEKEPLETLLSIMGSTPSFKIAHFTDGGEELIEMLNEYCISHEYQYQVNCTEKTFYEKVDEHYKDIKNTKVVNFPLQRRSYMIQSQEYNFIFVTTEIEENFRKDFLQRVHKIIRSAGNLILFLPKRGYTERDNWIAALEESLYVSTSVIDDMFEHYDIILSRKMHGWGD